MRSILLIAIAATLQVTLCAEDKGTKHGGAKPDPSAPSGAKTMTPQGVWKPIAAVMGGMRLPEPDINAITLTIRGENYEVAVEGEKVPDKGACVIDTTANPARMTITSKEGPNRGKTFLAIFEMKDTGSLRVCYDLSGKNFPTEFNAPKGTQLYLVGYRRQKE